MFVMGNNTDAVSELTITVMGFSTAFDISDSIFRGDNANAVSAATFVDGFLVAKKNLLLKDLAFNNDGTKMFILDQMAMM